MGLTVKVNGSINGLVHKGSNHFAKNTPPDVCKTPSPGGPVPIPYPIIISKSSDLKNGTKTVKADGGKMIAVKGCEYAICNGDEAGTVGGVVSNTNMKEAKFILYSFDVKMDGKNACRLSDKMTMNHQNTVCLGGTFPTPVNVVLFEQELNKIAEECNKSVNRKAKCCPPNPAPSGKKCTALGTKKHKCCEDKLKERANQDPPPSPKAESEVAYDSNGNRMQAGDDAAARSAANNAYNAVKGTPAAKGIWAKTYFSNGGAAFKADVLVGEPPSQAYDFKFNCKESKDVKISNKQKAKYFDNTGLLPRKIHKPGHRC